MREIMLVMITWLSMLLVGTVDAVLHVPRGLRHNHPLSPFYERAFILASWYHQ